MSMYDLTQKQRKDRPLAALNAAILEKVAQMPSSSVAFLTANGRGSRRSLVKDVCRLMTVMVNDMCMRSRKVGVATQHGFLLRSWEHIGEQAGMPLWRVKQCADYAKSRGWITSQQPREKYTGKDNREAFRGLVSIKRITEKYFKDMALFEQYEAAKKAAAEWLKMYARRLGRPIKYIQTPITLLRRRRKEAQQAKQAHPDAIPL